MVAGSETRNLSEFKVGERYVCERVRGPEYGREREGEKNMLKRREKEKHMCLYVYVRVVNYRLALAIGTRQLPLQGFSYVLLQLLVFNTP